VTALDREAFSAIYRDYVGHVTGFAARRLSSSGEVADLVAATFLVALERADSYDPSRGDPGTWLVGIAANLLANQRRRAVREALARARLDARALLSPDDVEGLVARIDASAEATRLRAAMESLSEAHREILLLATERSLSSAAAARAAGISPGAFRVRLSRARRALRRAMESQSASPAVGTAPTS
jgi:RNA polymerase sigma factor (sigma-70 family)